MNELRTKLLRAEEDRVEAEKMSKRCLKELQGKQREMGVVQQKVQDLKSVRHSPFCLLATFPLGLGISNR